MGTLVWKAFQILFNFLVNLQRRKYGLISIYSVDFYMYTNIPYQEVKTAFKWHALLATLQLCYIENIIGNSMFCNTLARYEYSSLQFFGDVSYAMVLI